MKNNKEKIMKDDEEREISRKEVLDFLNEIMEKSGDTSLKTIIQSAISERYRFTEVKQGFIAIINLLDNFHSSCEKELKEVQDRIENIIAKTIFESHNNKL